MLPGRGKLAIYRNGFALLMMVLAQISRREACKRHEDSGQSRSRFVRSVKENSQSTARTRSIPSNRWGCASPIEINRFGRAQQDLIDPPEVTLEERAKVRSSDQSKSTLKGKHLQPSIAGLPYGFFRGHVRAVPGLSMA